MRGLRMVLWTDLGIAYFLLIPLLSPLQDKSPQGQILPCSLPYYPAVQIPSMRVATSCTLVVMIKSPPSRGVGVSSGDMVLQTSRRSKLNYLHDILSRF